MASRTGEFDVNRLGRLFRPFCPISAFHSLHGIPLEGLKARGKKLILLDADNTVVRWRGEDFTPEALAWVKEAKELGFKLCILSNTRNPARLARLSETLGIPSIRGRFKPSTRMYRLALEQFGARPEEAVMVGDQILTDVLGANRSGIEAIWVHRIGSREFFGTRLNRLLERLILMFVYKALAVATPEEPAQQTVGGQFVRFAVVGGTSTLIDFGLFFLLYYHVPWDGRLLSETLGQWLHSVGFPTFYAHPKTLQQESIPVLQAFATGVAILNSFFWNRRWTFGISGSEHARSQFARFVVVSISGLVLTIAIVTSLTSALPFSEGLNIKVAKLVSVVAVAFWNFGGQRLWAFKRD